MKKFGKTISAALALSMMLTSSQLVNPFTADAAVSVSISPYDKYEINDGKFQGWGTSLCWWANRVGYSDSLAQKTADAFYGDDGLRLNIARFNIGGGDDPSHTHITRTDSNMPGYTKYSNGTVTYDWSADSNQRNVLQRAIKAAGDDMIVEMFSNSPPYYMCKSGCSTGGKDPNANNLKDDYYDDFAEYLAEVTYHYEKEWGIDVQSITAVNEPYTNFWGAYSAKQEGCHFDQGTSESTVIVELQKSLAKRGLNDIIISGTDETSIDTQITSFNKLSDAAKKAVGRIDTHTYGGSNRSGLKDTAIANGKNLWMSEVDSGSTAGSNNGEMGAALWLAERIAGDCNGLNCSAWVLWQVIDNHISSVGYNGNKDKGMVNLNGGYWGVAVADHDKDNIILTKKYYAFGQYTRYIRPGMTMLKCSGNTVSAYDEKNNQLVIVAYNKNGSASDYSFDLSEFASVGNSAKIIRTSNSESWKDCGTADISGNSLKVSLPANSVSTFIIDNVESDGLPENRIDLSNAVLSGSDSWKSDSATSFSKVFDGKNNTYFDGLGGGWVQADLGEMYDISAISYCPRSGYEYRMADGIFEFSADGKEWTKAYTVSAVPSYGTHYATRLLAEKARYVRYRVPDGAPKNDMNKDSTYCCNIAEIGLYGLPSSMGNLNKITPVSVSGSASWHDTESTACDKAFDGNTETYFDGVNGGYITADLGGIYDIDHIAYCPRKGYEYRMTDGFISVSSDGTNWKKILTITDKPSYSMNFTDFSDSPISARYVRYEVPEGAPTNSVNADNVYNCNIAELAVYGTVGKAQYDVNADGIFSIDDVIALQDYILGRTSKLADSVSADADGNGIIDVLDLVILKKNAN